jgi:glycosyltransferase involved in cell wall biosynthesis
VVRSATVQPAVSVVVPTRNRAERLSRLVESLRGQTLDPERFEVIVVDDASTDGTPAVIADAERSGSPRVRGIRRPAPTGPAAARNEGWRAARAPLVAFTDDDCRAEPAWLESGLAAAADAAVVQGRTDPDPDELHMISPFSRTVQVHGLGPIFESCNIFYARSLLEDLGGFDERFRSAGGEDTDLAWRAKARGVSLRYAPEAHVFHCVRAEGPIGMLRFALRRSEIMGAFAEHPEFRREQLHLGLFWSPQHAQLLRFLLAAGLMRRLPTVAALLARPYVSHLVRRRSRGLIAPYLVLYDLLEVCAVLRGAARNGLLVI